MLHQAISYAGRYRIERYTRGILTYDSGWFSNLITDAGLNALGTGFGVRCYVGDGTAAPTRSDTGLSGTLLGVITSSGAAYGHQIEAEPYYVEFFRTFSFNLGQVVGTVAEVAIGDGLPTPTFLFSRSLARNQAGEVEAVAFTEEEQLVVHYSLRLYAPVGDVESTVLVNGEYHSTLTRAADLRVFPTVNSWIALLGTAINVKPAWVFSCLNLYSGGIAESVLDTPLGLIAETSEMIAAPYVPGSLSLSAQAIFIPNSGSGTIRSIKSIFQGGGVFQTELDPPFSKTDRQTVVIDFSCSWQHYEE